MAKKQLKVVYAVFKGRFPGVYSTWVEAQAQVSRFQGADYRGYTATDGGRAKAEEDFKGYTQRTPVMGNTFAKAVNGDLQNESRARCNFQSLFCGAEYEATRRVQNPSLPPGLTSNPRKNSQLLEPISFPRPPSPTQTWFTAGIEEPVRVWVSGSAALGGGLPSSIQKHKVEYPILPSETTSRKKKQRPPSWQNEYDLPRKLQRRENKIERREGDGDTRPISKDNQANFVKTSSLKDPRSYVVDTDVSSLENDSSDDESLRNGVSLRGTADQASSSDSRSDEKSSEDSASEDSNAEIEETGVENGNGETAVSIPHKTVPRIGHAPGARSRYPWQATHDSPNPRYDLVHSDGYHLGNSGNPTTSRQKQKYHHTSMLNSFGQKQACPSCGNPLLHQSEYDMTDEEDEVVGETTYPSLPGQQKPHSVQASPGFIPYITSDNGELSHLTLTRPKPPPPPPTEPELCEEQVSLVNLIASGKNVFYTGSAGCGKSTVLKAFVQRLRDAGKTVQVVAPTGRAAVNIDGITFWTFAGWHQDSMKMPMVELAKGVRNFKWVNRRLCKTDVLVIDEISMMENHHFERLNLAMKSARNNVKEFGELQAKTNSIAPFGGVQLVVTGDFCQLPPVLPFQNCMHCGLPLSASGDGQVFTCSDKKHGPFLDIDKWAFRSAAWQECRFEHVNLTHIHRQSDREFIKILQKMRFGRPLSERDTNLLLNHETDTTNAVKLFPLLRQVREVNGEEFVRLKGPTISFNCLDNYHWNREHGNLRNHFTRNVSDNSLDCQDKHRFERRVDLKRHMLIILLVNLDISLGLINGAQGIILGFLEHDPALIPEQVGNHAQLKTTQIKEFVNRAETKRWPLVQFRNGTRTFTRLIKPYCAVNELGESKPYSWVSRTQLPLLPAWAISIHKSQGMTLSRVEVNVSKSFEKGQSYVALSRATSLQGLNVQALGDCNQGGNVQVMEFLREKFGHDVIDGVKKEE